jgi:hypothetical protein
MRHGSREYKTGAQETRGWVLVVGSGFGGGDAAGAGHAAQQLAGTPAGGATLEAHRLFVRRSWRHVLQAVHLVQDQLAILVAAAIARQPALAVKAAGVFVLAK